MGRGQGDFRRGLEEFVATHSAHGVVERYVEVNHDAAACAPCAAMYLGPLAAKPSLDRIRVNAQTCCPQHDAKGAFGDHRCLCVFAGFAGFPERANA